jgi:hypothetical protein
MQIPLAIVAVALGALDSGRASEKALASYTAWLQGCIQALQRDVPAMTPSAEAAARRFVLDGWTLAAWGDEGFVAEITGRAGGLMPIDPVDAAPGKTIVLLAPRSARLENDLDQARRFAERGDRVILFARRAVLDEAVRAGVRPAAAFDTHAAPHGGLVASGDTVCPKPSVVRVPVTDWFESVTVLSLPRPSNSGTSPSLRISAFP